MNPRVSFSALQTSCRKFLVFYSAVQIGSDGVASRKRWNSVLDVLPPHQHAKINIFAGALYPSCIKTRR